MRVVVRFCVGVPVRVLVVARAVLVGSVLVMRVSVAAFVRVRMEMHMQPVLRGLARGDHVDPPVLHAAGGEDAICELPELGSWSLQDDHFEAMNVVEMHVHRRPHSAAQAVLELVERFGERADVVIVDDGHGRHRVGAARDLFACDLGAGKVAEQLGARAVSLLHERIDLPKERALHRHTETHELITLGHALQHTS